MSWKRRIYISIVTVVAMLLGVACARGDKGFQTISSVQARQKMEALHSFQLLDVRTQGEFDEGHIGGAMLLPHDEIEIGVWDMLPDQNETIFIYCHSGRRSAIAAEALVKMGYTSVYDMGGIVDWDGEIVVE
ncbi:MAG: rhodanese-like domain-containing protein [Lachnospiraceae bacterium]|nr:rhodanese-like domain-containing protein [Lachnospiraceae bacterium]